LGESKHPLSGKTVVVTRAPEQSQGLSEALDKLGATVVWLPTVTFSPVENSTELDAALGKFLQFDWVFFTSQNTVRFLFQRGCQVGVAPFVQPRRPKIAAVGGGTAQAAKNLDIRVDFTPKTQTAESLVSELGPAALAGKKVLLPQSDRADDRTAAMLRELGAKVTEVIVYRTSMPESFDEDTLAAVKNGEVDAILFASPSAFENFSKVIAPMDAAELSRRVAFAAIGPTTGDAIRNAGASLAIESLEPSIDGLSKAVAQYFKSRHDESARHA
jgi:uroporphyrinogen-III synthase